MSNENKELDDQEFDKKEIENQESSNKPSGKKEAGRIKKSFQTRQFKSGAYSTVVTVLVVALVVVLNLVVSKLDLSTDLSKGNLFTLSKETKKILKDNKKDITLYYMVSDGSENEYIENVLSQYAKQSKYISMEKIDPIVKPAFASQYDITEDISPNDCLVVLEDTETAKYVSGSEMYYTEQDPNTGSVNYYLDVEGQITSAIQNVLSGSITKMYVVNGHSELPLAETMSKAFDKMNIEMEDLELLTAEKIPEDCDILMMNGPVTDITDNEKKVLLEYLQAGGDAVINLEYTTEETPNLQEVLEYYGIRSTQGVICETSGKYYYYPNYVVPEMGSGAFELFSDVQGYFIMPNAVGLNIMSEIRSSLSLQELLATSDSSYLKVDPSSGSSEKESGDVDGPFSVGIYATENLEEDAQTKLIVYASSDTFDESYVATSQLENGNLLKAAVSSMLTVDTEKVAIDAKSMDYSYINMTPALQLVWAAVLIILLPLSCLAVGFVIWLMRRKR
ncbi:MAG: GldG family protein [Lachnospiraceae bacterium]|nr:GldG family protein [Lachnospiraceae bacterium]